MPKKEMYVTADGERRFQVSAPVNEPSYDQLRRLAFNEETSIAAQVRIAVSEYLARQNTPSDGSV